MSHYYTIYDIERAFKFQFRARWHAMWRRIDVYAGEIVITVAPNTTTHHYAEFSQLLQEFFGGRFSKDTSKVILEYGNNTLDIIYEIEEETAETYDLPLFRSRQRWGNKPIQPLQGVPLFAFHSYKGGVGRTLSLISAVHALSKHTAKNGNKYKVLIVDSDIEAPGLTWLIARGNSNQAEISYLDALALMHGAEDWSDVISFVARKVQETAVEVPVDKQVVEHYFLPVYRMEDGNGYQLMDVAVAPAQIVNMVNREWSIANFLSELGKELGVDAVFVDLRAGISEYSAPLLFDPRVQKIYVTTTSLQSRRGLNVLLKEIYSTPLSEEYPLPDVFVTMLPPNSDEKLRNVVETDIFEGVSLLARKEEGGENIPLVFLDFAQELIHLDGLDMIDEKLKGTQMAKKILEVSQYWLEEQAVEEKDPIVGKKDFLDKLYSIAREYGEQSMKNRFMVTASLRNLARRFGFEVPIGVVLGTKGSGKTFLYKQMFAQRNWEAFIERIDTNFVRRQQKTYIIPLLWSQNMDDAIAMRDLVEALQKECGFSCDVDSVLGRKLRIQAQQDQGESEAKWNEFWKNEILLSFGNVVNSLKELQEYLERQDKRVVFIVDGLEDVFQNVAVKPEQKAAIRVLIQDIINELRSYPNGRVGLLVFSRIDIAQNCIEQNWGQFRAQYDSFELKWNRLEALRFVLWLVKEAGFLTDISHVEKATEEVLIKALERLWGKRMGKPTSREAESANWVLAALSDLKARMQPRDLVRFLKEAALRSMDNESYEDRYLMPTAIKDAIPPCSNEKINEITVEMSFLRDIFEKLRQKPEKERQVPFELQDYNLQKEEASLLEEQGFLLELENGYYMPEIIRYGLKFSYSQGARTKVVTLLRRANASLV